MFSALSISGLERFVEADSLLKARQTRNWREMDGSVKQERVAPVQAPSFDFAQIMVGMGNQLLYSAHEFWFCSAYPYYTLQGSSTAILLS